MSNDFDEGYPLNVENERFKLILFILYTILWQGLIWTGFTWIVIINGDSAWWFLGALIMAANQLKPNYFGLSYKDDVSE